MAPGVTFFGMPDRECEPRDPPESLQASEPSDPGDPRHGPGHHAPCGRAHRTATAGGLYFRDPASYDAGRGA